MVCPTTRGSREPFPQLQGPVFMRRPSQVSIEHLSNPRLPARYLQAGLKMNAQTCCKTRRIIRDLALRHIDFSIPYLEQSESQLDFFKREVLLDVELSHLMWYQDAWVVEVFLRIMYQRPKFMRGFQQLDSELQITLHDRPCRRQSNTRSINLATQLEDIQHDRPRQMSLSACSDNQVTQPKHAQHYRPDQMTLTVYSNNQANHWQPEDAQHGLVCSENQGTQPKDNRVSTIQGGGASGTASCLALLSTLLASTPDFHRFHAVITEADLSTDEHLRHFFRMTSTGREKFITQALTETSTLFERVVIMDILEELRKTF